MKLKCTVIPKSAIFGILAAPIRSKVDVELSKAQAKRCIMYNAILSTIINGESIKINMKNIDDIFNNADKSSISKVINKDTNNEELKPEVKADSKEEKKSENRVDKPVEDKKADNVSISNQEIKADSKEEKKSENKVETSVSNQEVKADSKEEKKSENRVDKPVEDKKDDNKKK